MNFETIKNSFNTYFVNVLKTQYADFAGRATRTQFWMFNLYFLVVFFVLGIVFGLIGAPIIVKLAALAVVVPSVAVAVRRVRDLGISGWFILICLVPFIGGILLLIGYCMPTDSLKSTAEKFLKKK